MARVTIEDCLKNVDSRFSLVHLAVRRVLQLRGGIPSLVNAPKNKEIVVALREIAAGKATTENIRQLEDVRGLHDVVSRAKEDATRREVEEIVEDATRFDVSMEYPGDEQIIEQDEE